MREIACRAAPSIGLSKTSKEQCGGSHGNSLITLSRIRPYVKRAEGEFAAGSARAQRMCLTAHASVVTYEGMANIGLFGRDSWAHVLVRNYVFIRSSETAVTFFERESGARNAPKRFWMRHTARLFVEPAGGKDFVARFSVTRCLELDAMLWCTVNVTNVVGKMAAKGSKRYSTWFQMVAHRRLRYSRRA